jgi:hypothetical protein
VLLSDLLDGAGYHFIRGKSIKRIVDQGSRRNLNRSKHSGRIPALDSLCGCFKFPWAEGRGIYWPGSSNYILRTSCPQAKLYDSRGFWPGIFHPASCCEPCHWRKGSRKPRPVVGCVELWLSGSRSMGDHCLGRSLHQTVWAQDSAEGVLDQSALPLINFVYSLGLGHCFLGCHCRLYHRSVDGDELASPSSSGIGMYAAGHTLACKDHERDSRRGQAPIGDERARRTGGLWVVSSRGFIIIL